MTATRSSRAERFVALDLLRGIAALAIVTRHFPWPGNVPPLLPRDYLAVDLFFILSGFVLAHAYWKPLREPGGLRRFARDRLIRLYPLYCLAIVIGSAIALGELAAGLHPGESMAHWASSLAFNLAFLPAPDPFAADRLYPFAFPAWSLFWELAVNLGFALLAPLLNRRMLVALILAGVCLLTYAAAGYGSLDVGSSWWSFWGGGCRVLFGFFAGVALWHLRQRLSALPSVPAWLLAAILLATFVPAAAMFGPFYDVAIVVLIYPPLVLLGANAVMRRPAVGLWLGHISYALYVLHVPIAQALKHLSGIATGRDLADFGMAALLPYLAVTILAAWAATRGFDDRLRARWRRPRQRLLATLPFTTTDRAAP